MLPNETHAGGELRISQKRERAARAETTHIELRSMLRREARPPLAPADQLPPTWTRALIVIR